MIYFCVVLVVFVTTYHESQDSDIFGIDNTCRIVSGWKLMKYSGGRNDMDALILIKVL